MTIMSKVNIFLFQENKVVLFIFDVVLSIILVSGK